MKITGVNVRIIDTAWGDIECAGRIRWFFDMSIIWSRVLSLYEVWSTPRPPSPIGTLHILRGWLNCRDSCFFEKIRLIALKTKRNYNCLRYVLVYWCFAYSPNFQQLFDIWWSNQKRFKLLLKDRFYYLLITFLNQYVPNKIMLFLCIAGEEMKFLFMWLVNALTMRYIIAVLQKLCCAAVQIDSWFSQIAAGGREGVLPDSMPMFDYVRLRLEYHQAGISPL